MTTRTRSSADAAYLAALLTEISHFVSTPRWRGRSHFSKHDLSAAEKRLIKSVEMRLIKNAEGRFIIEERSREDKEPDVELIHPIPLEGSTFVIREVKDRSPGAISQEASRGRDSEAAEIELGLRIARLMFQLQRMIQESGSPEGFDAAEWISRWIKEPLPALGGERPIDLVGTEEGMAQVTQVLDQMQSSAYA